MSSDSEDDENNAPFLNRREAAASIERSLIRRKDTADKTIAPLFCDERSYCNMIARMNGLKMEESTIC